MKLLTKIALLRFHKLCLASVLEDLKKKHPHLASKIDFLAAQDPSPNKKYLPYATKILASGQALEQEIADVVKLFHTLKDKLDIKDINQWNFTELRDKLFAMRDLGEDKSKTHKKKELKEEIKKVETQGAEKLYEDKQCVLIYVATKAQACFYGKVTKWCITMENERYFENYASNNVVFYYVLRKDVPETSSIQRIAISVQRDEDNQLGERPGMSGWDEPMQFWNTDDIDIGLDSALFDLDKAAIINIIKQDVPTRPMGFLARVKFKPDSLTLEDYKKNMTDSGTKANIAGNTKNIHVLNLLSNETDPEVIDALGHNRYLTHALFEKLSKIPDAEIALATNPQTPTDILYYLATKPTLSHDLGVKWRVAANINVSRQILEILAKEPNDRVREEIASNITCLLPQDIIDDFAQDPHPNVRLRLMQYRTPSHASTRSQFTDTTWAKLLDVEDDQENLKYIINPSYRAPPKEIKDRAKQKYHDLGYDKYQDVYFTTQPYLR